MSEGIKRRDFLKVMGVSGAGAVAGCSTGEVERLIPYVIPPEDIVPGVPTWYASTCRECPAGCGIHVETHEGRATKVEGNPGHPISHGNLCARGQASVQGLYHPDRHQGPTVLDPGIDVPRFLTWSAAEREVADRIRGLEQAGRGNRVVFLTGAYTGTMERLVNDWTAAVGARRVVYEPFPEQPRGLDFANAEVLISFGADFLETWGSPVDYAWQFAQMRDHRRGGRGKFIWIAPHRPLTGLNADQWLAPRPGTEAVLAGALGGTVDPAAAARETGIEERVITDLITEMAGRSVVAMGPGAGYSGRNSAGLTQAISRLNTSGAIPSAAVGLGGGGTAGVLRLVEEMRRGEVELVLIDGQINPAYTLPGMVRFAEAIRRVPTRVSFSTFPDETSLLCNLTLPGHHFLEEWDDYVPAPGVRLLVQPVMRPVFNTKQTGDVLLALAGYLGVGSVSAGISGSTYYDYLRSNWAASGAPGWREALTAGGAWGGDIAAELSAPAPGAAVPAPAAAPALIAAPTPAAPAPADLTQRAPPRAAPATDFHAVALPAAGGPLNLVVYPSYRFFDGRTANRPWLLELPDPVTKVAWQSWVEIHPRTAVALGIEQGDSVEVTSRYGTVTTRAFLYPGVRPDTVAIQMGLGHDAFGRYTEGVGVNANLLLGPEVDAATGDLARYGHQVTLRRLGGNEVLPQGLFEGGQRVQSERNIARAVSLAELVREEREGHAVIPGEEQHIETLRGYGGFAPAASTTDPSAYPPAGTHYGEYVEGATRWAMVVDLSRCIGCSACVTACYAENNIPVVGPTEVAKGRELSWLRIERYFGVGKDEDEAHADGATDDVRFLPMMCQHCGNAPCEPVCPVYAAYHTPDGLNGQVYNRCVGTRYCANNCPYKVRYFNWFTYEFAAPLNWQLNPDVAVREKGVMEKCTFCVQRIREGERRAAMENRPTRDGEIVPACVQTCPTEVFVFGNIADPDSQVAQAARDVRGYRALQEVNTQSAIVYLKKVTLAEPAVAGHGAAAGAAPH